MLTSSLPLLFALTCTVQVNETRRHDLGGLLLTEQSHVGFPLVASHYHLNAGPILDESNRQSGRIAPESWIDIVEQLLSDENDVEIDWSSLQSLEPGFDMSASAEAHQLVDALIGVLEETLTAQTQIEVACIELEPGTVSGETAVFMPVANARNWIEESRAAGRLIGSWNVTARPGKLAWLEAGDEQIFAGGAAPQIAQSAWQIDTEMFSATTGSHLMVQVAPLNGGHRLQVALEQRLPIGALRTREVLISGIIGSTENAPADHSEFAQLQDQPVQTFGFLLDLDLPQGQAALVRAEWSALDPVVGHAQRVYVIQASGGAPSGVREVPFGRKRLLLAAPGSLRVSDWPQVYNEVDGRLHLGDVEGGQSVLGYADCDAPDPGPILERFQDLYELRLVAGWVIGIGDQPEAGNADQEPPSKPLQADAPARSGRARLELMPAPGQHLKLHLPLTSGRGACAYLVGTDLAICDYGSEVATASGVTYGRMALRRRGLILQLQAGVGRKGQTRLDAVFTGAWPLSASQAVDALESSPLDQLPVRLFNWNLEQRVNGALEPILLGSKLASEAHGQLVISF